MQVNNDEARMTNECKMIKWRKAQSIFGHSGFVHSRHWTFDIRHQGSAHSSLRLLRFNVAAKRLALDD
jgi:hypothetical protein